MPGSTNTRSTFYEFSRIPVFIINVIPKTRVGSGHVLFTYAWVLPMRSTAAVASHNDAYSRSGSFIVFWRKFFHLPPLSLSLTVNADCSTCAAKYFSRPRDEWQKEGRIGRKADNGLQIQSVFLCDNRGPCRLPSWVILPCSSAASISLR